ncbi:MAG TPA: hypothetical protein VI139_01015, partial [Gemmatimonadales bacterium]
MRIEVSRVGAIAAVACLGLALYSAAAPASPNAGDWPMAAGDYANTRYSALEQVTRENAKNLKLAFSFPTGALRGHEAAPLVVNGTMYVVTPYPNYLYALDLSKPGANLKWKF